MAKNSNPIVDYYDLKIPIPDHVVEVASKALEEFEEHHDYIVLSPKLKNNLLKINSTDFIALLGYLEFVKQYVLVKTMYWLSLHKFLQPRF